MPRRCSQIISIADMSDLLVLCYHSVSNEWPAKIATTPVEFERQMRLLVARGYRGARFGDAMTGAAAGKTLAVTFDDGYRSVVEVAFPILTELGLVGSVFVPTDFVGTDGPMRWPGIEQWADGASTAELLAMSWEELDQLIEAGWEVGSHSRSHARLTQLDDAALSAELRGSRELCEHRLGTRCRSIAYPYGDVDARVVSAAEHAGYQAGAALVPPFRALEPLRWPRMGIYKDSLNRFRVKVSPTGRRVGRRLVGTAGRRHVDRA
jgi:peptidoglycan/xylan/chitin deacetylase (PgdA/CDA1 family)